MHVSVDDWEVEEPEKHGLDPNILCEADYYMRDVIKRINSIVIVKDDVIVFERYYNQYDKMTPQLICSVIKTFIPAIIGIAVDKGLIKDINQRILEFFPKINKENIDPLMNCITVWNLITMTTGILCRYGSNGYEPVLEKMARSQKWIESILSLPIITKNLGNFKYNGLNPELLTAIITAVTGENACRFANKNLFSKIGIPECESLPVIRPQYNIGKQDNSIIPKRAIKSNNLYGADEIARSEKKNIWTEAPENCSYGNMWLHIRPRDMCRFGSLFLNGGRFNGEQIISEQWVTESLKPQITLSHHQKRYLGYMWYISRNCEVMQANGYGGQRIFLIPSRNMVVSFTSKYLNRDMNGRKPEDIMNKFIYPMLNI